MKFEDGMIITDITDRFLAPLPYTLSLEQCPKTALLLMARADHCEGIAIEKIEYGRLNPMATNTGATEVDNWMNRALLCRQAASRLVSFVELSELSAGLEAS
jgi:hypothetical protein